MKLRVAKAILWFLAGLGLPILALRILHGPGSVTALTDIVPWGLWKGGGVVALVAIGGAGFTIAMLTYIFQVERFKPLVRGAVLLGLLCYSSVGFGLTIDIGIWWRIVFPVWHWQFHSVLFEVAWCIMLYLVVLCFEFSHTMLEKFEWKRMLLVVEKASIIFVIAGISLSTLHQSSLGTLFLATPFRLHPLWYTDLLPLLFFITSIGLGCLTISVVTIIVHWLYDAEPPMRALTGVARISAWVMTGYVVLRFAGIFFSGKGGYLFDATWDTANFWLEILLSAAIPMIFLFQKKFRESKTALFWVGVCATVGMSLNRVNVAGLATLSLTESIYFPTWSEWAITLGILAGAGLAFLFAAEYFDLFKGLSKQRVQETYAPGTLDHTDWRALYFGSHRFGEAKAFSFVFILAAAFSFGALSESAVFGISPERTPVQNVRMVDIVKVENPGGPGNRFVVTGEEPSPNPGGRKARVLMIDGNRDGRYVLFDHGMHMESCSPGGKEESCMLCHHMNKPFNSATPCSACHSDMYLNRNIFDHAFHVKELGGNDHCAECHTDPDLPKIMENTKDCLHCHMGMRPEGSRVNIDPGRRQYRASGYMDAMHSLCITCHEEEQKKRPELGDTFSSCIQCHRSLPILKDKAWEHLR